MSSHVGLGALSMLAASLTLSPGLATAQDSGRRTFSSAQEASQALVDAVQRDDRQGLTSMLDGQARLISSGDDGRDKAERQMFVEKYGQMHRLTKEPNGTTILYVGAENWPFPVPLVRTGGRWHFDSDAGAQEVVRRRIGENELAAIAVSRALVDAQKEYAAVAHDGGGAGQYAARLPSTNGKHDGLYWDAAGNDSSPIGPLLARADAGQAQSSTPYWGYYYRVLAGQGAHAQGGAKSYDVNGRMTGGFAIVAYPSEYRSSGVMTFIVSDDGIVHQRDLGPQTAKVASAMRLYDPSSGWRRVE